MFTNTPIKKRYRTNFHNLTRNSDVVSYPRAPSYQLDEGRFRVCWWAGHPLFYIEKTYRDGQTQRIGYPYYPKLYRKMTRRERIRSRRIESKQVDRYLKFRKNIGMSPYYKTSSIFYKGPKINIDEYLEIFDG